VPRAALHSVKESYLERFSTIARCSGAAERTAGSKAAIYLGSVSTAGFASRERLFRRDVITGDLARFGAM
jgi:hypothetical protein